MWYTWALTCKCGLNDYTSIALVWTNSLLRRIKDVRKDESSQNYFSFYSRWFIVDFLEHCRLNNFLRILELAKMPFWPLLILICRLILSEINYFDLIWVVRNPRKYNRDLLNAKSISSSKINFFWRLSDVEDYTKPVWLTLRIISKFYFLGQQVFYATCCFLTEKKFREILLAFHSFLNVEKKRSYYRIRWKDYI